jgi:hypothetical protein
MKRLVFPVACATLLGLAACAASPPPFVRAPSSVAASEEPHTASVVFLWPETSCDPPGYFTFATADGRFVGTLSRGAQLTARVPTGERTIVAWNVVMEGATHTIVPATVPVLHADLREGHTYYVRLALGDWDRTGPHDVWGRRSGMKLCAKSTDMATSAMEVVSPASERWAELADWTAALTPLVPDQSAGQAWLDQNRATLRDHVAVAEASFASLLPKGRRLATLGPDDASR